MCNTNSENIKVSVVIPVYNADNYLRQALDSIVSQTLREIEIISVDDGSTDHSLAILKEYQSADNRIRIITQNNAGPSIARNKGLARARGEYVIFLDADDFYEPTLLESLYGVASRDSLDIAIARYDLYNNKKGIFEPSVKTDHGKIFESARVVSKNEFPDQILLSVTGFVWNKLFRRAFLLEKRLTFNPWIRVFEDTYFVVTAMSLADRVGKVFDVLVHHRVYSGQSKNKLFRKYYNQVPVLYAEMKEFLRANGMYIPLAKSFLNLSASRCYTIYNLLWRDAKREFWDMLHEDYAETLGWEERVPEDFEREDVREFVADVLMFTHEQYEYRRELGINRIGGIEHASKIARLRKKVKNFFVKIFGGKKKK